MVIDRVSEDIAGVGSQGVGMMTSPIGLSAFYGNSPLGMDEPAYHTGDWLPRPPQSDSESGKPWSTAVQTPSYLSHINGETTMGSVSHPSYQGVRVKNPAKEMIMQKHSGYASWSPGCHNQQLLQHYNIHDHHTVPSTIQEGAKRSADHVLTPSTSPKRPASLYNNVLTPSSYGTSKEEQPCSEPYLDIINTVLQRESAPVSITTLQVQEIPPQAGLPTLPPQPGTVTEIKASCLYSTIDAQTLYPAKLPEAMENTFLSQPLTLQPDPLPLPVPHQPFSFDAPRGISFFQWQIEQEEKKLAGLAPELLVAGDSDGDTFLHIAVAQGRRALSYVLARKMALISMLDVKEHNGQSALQVSVAANQHLIVQDLLTLGAQINTADCWGRSPLHVCAEKGHILTLQAIHRTLQATGQQLNMEVINYDGLTALHTAVLSHNAVVQDLSEMSSRSPLTQELMQRRKRLGECVCTLLLMGASHKTKDHKSGRTPLYMAAEEANVELMRLFLDQPDSLAIINEKAYSGNTALHVVSALEGRVAQVDAVRLLMRRGADPSAKNLENEQPVQLVPEGPVGDQVRRILKGKGAQAKSYSL
ncbi:hypothetical protein MATL_G00149130 [Megalops atlanticus]|uniref:OCA domain-containing protein n=1 Tax=Megalops atlanticus TaxID=7932 RepID=A0A9D3T240_MEGAT|nr:hypothetical protein MATL_G00149130 [Megalops atlanticus]